MSNENINSTTLPDNEKEILVNFLKKRNIDAKLSHSLETLYKMYKDVTGKDFNKEDILPKTVNENTENKEIIKNTETVKNTNIEKPENKEESLSEYKQRVRNESLALVRCRITCHNPNKQNIDGEYFTNSNEIIGNIRKYVPFGAATEYGYHIPQAIVNVLEQKKFQRIAVRKNSNNINEVDLEKSTLEKEFTVEKLPPLTPKELEELKQRQIATRSLEDN